jgi:hypothetical protein
VVRSPDLAHAPFANQGSDLIGADMSAGCETHAEPAEL